MRSQPRLLGRRRTTSHPTNGQHLARDPRCTASAPRHLRAWELAVYWGDNQSKPVAADNYSHHIASPPIWTGLSSVVIPPPGPTPWDATVPGDPTSIHCAHTFFLYAWDRVINGWGYVHGDANYHKSITLFF